MKKRLLLLSILFLFNMYAQACEGDCVVCHPNLVKEDGKLDKDHAILVTCKTCHTQEEMEKIDMGSGCGQDCWDCHDIKKVTASNVEQHRGLQECIDCHVTIDKNMLGGVSSAPAFNELPTLDELMSSSSQTDTAEVNESSVVEEINKTQKQLTSETKKVSTEPSEAEEGLWDTIVNFFKTIWQSIVSIFT